MERLKPEVIEKMFRDIGVAPSKKLQFIVAEPDEQERGVASKTIVRIVAHTTSAEEDENA